MPYTESNAPDHVKKLPPAKRRQWISVFNSAVGKGASESSAFAQANGVAKKEYCPDLGEDSHQVEQCEKCMADSPVSMVAVDMPVAPLGGARTLAEADSFIAAAEVQEELSHLKHLFDAVYRNIMADESTSLVAKATAVRAAANDWADRVRDASREAGEGEAERKTLLARLGDGLKGAFARALQPDHQPQPAHPDAEGLASLSVTKDANGNWRWFTIASNNFKDRDGEWFEEAAHQEYVAHVDATKEYPDLWLWHTPGSRIGVADMVEYADHFLIGTGTFDPGQEAVAAKMAADAPKLGISHGFHYDYKDKVDGTFKRYRTYEISILPAERAANPWTALSVAGLKEENMPLRPDKRAFLETALGPERTKVIEDQLGVVGKELEAAGIGFKDLTDQPAAAAAPTATATATAAPAQAHQPGAATNPMTTQAQQGDPPQQPGEQSNPPTDAPPAQSPPPENPPASSPTTPPGQPTPAPAPGEGTPGNGDGGQQPPADGEEGKALGALMEGLKALAGVPDQLAQITTRLDTLEKSDDEKLAARLQARGAPTNGQRPTESADNVVTKELADQAIDGNTADKGAPTGSPVQDYVSQLGGSRVQQGQ